MADLLVVAATERELAGAAEVRTLVCGIGPVEAAVHTAAELARRPAAALLHVGLAGARGLRPPALVVGTEAVYCDLAAAVPVVARARPDRRLLEAVCRLLPDAVCVPIGTSARVGGVDACEVEAMEGFAVLRAAELAAVPAVEVRVVVNDPDEQDRERWRLADGLDELERVLPRLVAGLAD